MKSTRVWDLLGLMVFAAVATWIVVRVFYGSIPPIPVYAGASLYIVALLEVIFAFVVRSRVSRSQVGVGARQLHPITVARALALAKASALVGAAALGAWLGFLVHVFPLRATVRAATSDSPGAIVGLIAGLALAAAALWLEHCCKTPEDTHDAPVS